MNIEKTVNVDALVECPHCLVYSINSDDCECIDIAICPICGNQVSLVNKNGGTKNV